MKTSIIDVSVSRDIINLILQLHVNQLNFAGIILWEKIKHDNEKLQFKLANFIKQ